MYQEIFGDALEQYNSKQKRADRKIEDYYDHIQKSKNGEKLFYEDVVQWGKKEDFQKPETRERAKEALVKYVEGFEERNPNLKLIGAYIHMDEASPICTWTMFQLRLAIPEDLKQGTLWIRL